MDPSLRKVVEIRIINWESSRQCHLWELQKLRYIFHKYSYLLRTSRTTLRRYVLSGKNSETIGFLLFSSLYGLHLLKIYLTLSKWFNFPSLNLSLCVTREPRRLCAGVKSGESGRFRKASVFALEHKFKGPVLGPNNAEQAVSRSPDVSHLVHVLALPLWGEVVNITFFSPSSPRPRSLIFALVLKARTITSLCRNWQTTVKGSPVVWVCFTVLKHCKQTNKQKWRIWGQDCVGLRALSCWLSGPSQTRSANPALWAQTTF